LRYKNVINNNNNNEKNESNKSKSLKNNRSKPKNYIETALLLCYLLTTHRHWPSALHIWSNP